MGSSTPAILVVLALVTLAAAAAPGSKEAHVLFEDAFDKDALKDGWRWHRENPETWRLRDGGLEIRVEPGRGETVKNVLWRDASDLGKGAYAFEVTVTNHTAPTTQWEQAGLILYRAGVPVAKVGKELVDGKLCIIPGEVPMDAATVRLRLVVKRDDYVAQYQPDARGEFKTAAAGRIVGGRNIPAAGKLPTAAANSGDQVSLQCFEGPPDAEHWIRFDDFRVTQEERLPAARK
jgi:hypothetical protein